MRTTVTLAPVTEGEVRFLDVVLCVCVCVCVCERETERAFNTIIFCLFLYG